MSFESALYAYLALDAGVYGILGVGGSPAEIRLYPVEASQSVTPPYAVYQRVGGGPDNTLNAASISHTRLQIDCYGTTAKSARELGAAMTLALNALAVVLPGLGRVTFTCLNTVDMPEPDVRLKRRMLEFSVWHPE